LAASGGGAATFLYLVRSTLTPMRPVLRLVGVIMFGRYAGGSREFYWELRRYIERTALPLTIKLLAMQDMVRSADPSRAPDAGPVDPAMAISSWVTER
jgi:hypothetical protein